MRCEEREALWEEFNRAVDLLTTSVDTLGKPCAARTFAKHLVAVQTAKELCCLMRDKWEEHLRVHQCDGSAAD